MEKRIFKFVSENNSKIRFDVFLQSKLNKLSRTQIKKFIISGNAMINKKSIKEPSKIINKNDVVFLTIPPPPSSYLEASDININIIYEDKDLLVINKQPGLVIHPGAGNIKNTLVNGLITKFKKNLSKIGGKLRPGIVHRIDKDTSGVIVVAKNDLTHLRLSKQFSEHTIKRVYEALVWGCIRPMNGTISSKITRSNRNRQIMTVSFNKGKIAVTNYKTSKVFTYKKMPIASLIECTLQTGRTHQIRVHMNFKGNSIVGDKTYGKKKKFKNIDALLSKTLTNFNRQALHAKSLGFKHPITKKNMIFSAPRPSDFEKMLKILKKY